MQEMTAKQRIRELQNQCPDWDQIVAHFHFLGNLPRREVERAILDLMDHGLVRIRPQPGGPTAFELIIPPEAERHLAKLEAEGVL